MTAEIAVLNKSAVVLAADSAVTIGGGMDAKIYNTANKIFHLCEDQPIGLMIFNRLDFMGLPLEVVIKEFRRHRSGKRFTSVEECKNDFLDYLSKDVPVNTQDRGQNLYFYIDSLLREVRYTFESRVDDEIKRTGRYYKGKQNSILQGVISELITEEQSAAGRNSVSGFALSQDEKTLLEAQLPRHFRLFDVSAQCRNQLHRLAAFRISNRVLSDGIAGLVFAGFGDSEWCPTLIQVETDGLLKGRMLMQERVVVDIGRTGPDAEVLGFAQDDMVQSFVNGIDPMVRNFIGRIIRETSQSAAELILKPRAKDEDALRAIMSALDTVLGDLSDKMSARVDSFTANNLTKDVKDMVRFMPKEELATLAESLIEITSLKRKVTRDRETVGGEVDVAVISRAEGMVWVKRKHYFPRDLNDRYFSRFKGAS